MKAVIIYSGKGGVGKNTTTANIARLLAKQGNKVFIIDADINTPSMNTEFEGDHQHEMIWVHSSGNMFSKFIYLEKSMVRQYLEPVSYTHLRCRRYSLCRSRWSPYH